MTAEEDDESWQRQHGMHYPFDPFQGIALFAYLLFMMTMFTFHLPLYWNYNSVLDVFLILFAVWAPLNVITYVLAAVSPVHDLGLDKKCEEWELPYAPPGYTACYTCRAHVDAHSKHCWKCNKCVVGFDHHCKWLNHCVGERNYLIFAIFLGNTTGLMASQLGLSIWVLHHANGSREEFDRLCQQTFGSDFEPRRLFGFLVFACVLECIAWLPLAQLSWLHIYLKYRGISTYQNILENRQQKRDERSEREKLGMTGPEPCCHSVAVWSFKREKAKKEKEKQLGSPSYKSSALALDHSFSARPEGGNEGSTLTTNDPEGTTSRQVETPSPPDQHHQEDRAYSEVKEQPDDVRSQTDADQPGPPLVFYGDDDYHEPAEPPSAGPASYPDDSAVDLNVPSPASGGNSRGFNSSQVTLKTMPNLESPSLFEETHSPAFDATEISSHQRLHMLAGPATYGSQSPPSTEPHPDQGNNLPGLRQSSELPLGSVQQANVFEHRRSTTSPDHRDPNFIPQRQEGI